MDSRGRNSVVLGGEEFHMPAISKRTIGFVVIIVVGLIFLVTTFYKVGADEVGIIRRFGRYSRTTQPGLHLKWPFGIETLKKPKVKRNFTQEFGFRTVKPGVLTQIRKTGYADESLMLTGDLNVGVVEWIVQYKIEDPKAYLFNVTLQRQGSGGDHSGHRRGGHEAQRGRWQRGRGVDLWQNGHRRGGEGAAPSGSGRV